MTGLKRVAVVGAGVIGMSSAYRIQTEIPNVEVTLISKEFSPALTSDGAAGLWDPYDLSGTDPIRGERWAQDTYKHLVKLSLSPHSIQCGVSVMTYVSLSRGKSDPSDDKPIAFPSYERYVLNLRRLSDEELSVRYPNHRAGFTFTSVICEPRHYIPWLTKLFVKAGGQLRTQTITDLSDICDEFDLVIHCTGLGAAQTVNDNNMVPIRGQVIKVRPRHVINTTWDSLGDSLDDLLYLIPGRDFVTLGGTYNVGDTDRSIKEDVKQWILDGCTAIEPGVKGAEVVFDWCGLRPSRRGGTRLEVDSSLHPHTKVIHNYGHGGIGISLHWGCAGEVVELAMKELSSHPRSKL